MFARVVERQSMAKESESQQVTVAVGAHYCTQSMSSKGSFRTDGK
jgi:hypothetical protein